MMNEKIKELSSKIDYTVQPFEQRKKIADEISNDPFIIDYLTNYDGNLNSSDSLAEQDTVFNLLDRVSSYLLNSEEVREDKKDNTEYRFYTDEAAFEKAINKELNLGDMNNGEEENIIHFLKKENRNFKKPKTQTIKKSDYKRDELHQVLTDYDAYLKSVTTELKDHKNSKLSRFQLSRISGSVKQDMIMSKDILLGVFGYKTNASESSEIDWSSINFGNYEHMRALICLRPGYRNDEDLMYIIEDFNDKLKKIKLTNEQWEIIDMLRSNMRVSEIGREFNTSRQNIDQRIKLIINKFCKKYSTVR